MDDVWRSAPASMGDSWTRQASGAPWSKRAFHAAVALPNEANPTEPGGVLLMGGLMQDGSEYSQDVWLGSSDGSSWTQQTAAAGWSGRMSLSAVVLPDGSIL